MALLNRNIGKDQVAAPGLGCFGMSAFYEGSGDDEGNLRTLKAAYDLGVRLFDTADIYGTKGMGENERLIGRAIKELGWDRSKLFIATKFGFAVDENGTYSIRGDPAYIERAIENSLNSLGLSYIDLYYQHRVDPNTPIEDTVKALAKLKEAGKIRYIGLSECSAATLRKASQVARIDAVQIEYSLFETSPETNGLLDACKELGVAFVAYSPLGRGMLSGRFKSPDDLPEDDGRRGYPRYSAEHFAKNIELVDEIKKLAARKGCTSSQLAVAWVHAQWNGIIAIPGTKNIDRLKENIGSVTVKLTQAELSEIRSILQSFPVAGDRYPDWMMKGVNI